MSKVSIQGDASGTGTLTIAAPNTNSNYTLTLPEATGTVLTSAGGQTITKSADTVQTLNRTTSDGTILEFQKDGTKIGQINSLTGKIVIGSGDVGIRFHDANDAIFPFDASTNALRDSAIDIGGGSQRFKDLYLSGGVYLGGTGAANYLDDYEEGTFSSELDIGGTTVNTETGYYTKIGRLVTLHVKHYNIVVGAATGNLTVQNLPFTSTSSALVRAIGSVWGNRFGRPAISGVNADTIISLMEPSSTYIAFLGTLITNSNSPSLTEAEVLSTGSDLFTTITYFTD